MDAEKIEAFAAALKERLPNARVRVSIHTDAERGEAWAVLHASNAHWNHAPVLGQGILTDQKTEMTLMTDSEIQTEIDKINQLTQIEMAELQRFAPSGHRYFDLRLPFNAGFQKRFAELGGMTSEISKNIGWNRELNRESER